MIGVCFLVIDRTSSVGCHVRTSCGSHSLSCQMLYEIVVKWKACVNILNFWVRWKVGNFLTGKVTTSLSGQTLLHGVKRAL
jgi:hypothetical protein